MDSFVKAERACSSSQARTLKRGKLQSDLSAQIVSDDFAVKDLKDSRHSED